jgi:phosphatidylglycerol---prolipoprotein diacylglyceryl transferase
VHPRLLQFGHIAIPTYGALTALALVAALAAAIHFGRRLSLNPNKLWNLALYAILTTLIGARLLLVISHFNAFRQHPFWILGLTTLYDWWIPPASVALGVAAAILYSLAEGLPLLRVADALAPAAVLAVFINRIGAFLAGLDVGTLTTAPWAVTYTSRIAALWYHTPLGVPLHPVQLYDVAVAAFTLGLLIFWIPRCRQDGELAGATLFLCGIANVFLSFYRFNLHDPILSLAISIVAVLGGAALWIERPGSVPGSGTHAHSYTATDEPPPAP